MGSNVENVLFCRQEDGDWQDLVFTYSSSPLKTLSLGCVGTRMPGCFHSAPFLPLPCVQELQDQIDELHSELEEYRTQGKAFRPSLKNSLSEEFDIDIKSHGNSGIEPDQGKMLFLCGNSRDIDIREIFMIKPWM